MCCLQLISRSGSSRFTSQHVRSRDESISGIPMGPMGPVGIPWELEVLIYFRENEKEHGNGLVRMGGNDNTIFPISHPEQANKFYSRYTIGRKTDM